MASNLKAAIDIMHKRVKQLGVTSVSIRRVGRNEIEVVLPDENPASAQETTSKTEQPQGVVGKTAQLYFYDWEANVIGASGKPEPDEGTLTGDSTAAGPGGVTSGLLEYQAVLRAAKRPAILRKTDTTLTPGCTPRQADGCVYGSWYLLDATRERVLRGPADTMQDLYAGGYKPPAAAKPRAVRVNPGTVLVQARPVEGGKAGVIINASPNSWYVLNDDPALSGADLVDPQQGTDQTGERPPAQSSTGLLYTQQSTGRPTPEPNVVFGFTPSGQRAFETLTRELAHRGREAQLPGVSKEAALQHFAVVLDGQAITVPSIDYTQYPEGINAANGSEISGGLTIVTARNLAAELRSGALPIKLELVSRSLVATSSS